jgi:SAM-dependent methyltransferase
MQSAGQKLSDVQRQIGFSGDLDEIRGFLDNSRTPVSMREQIAPNDRYEEYIHFLNSLDHPNEAARRYLESHLHYPDEHFDLVVACELIEHLVLDPMQMLLECGRVLAKDVALLITTPNIASHSSLCACADGVGKFSHLFALSCRFLRKHSCTGRYPAELAQMLAAAAFGMECLFTEKIGGYNSVARKSAEPAVMERRPAFLYEQ